LSSEADYYVICCHSSSQ